MARNHGRILTSIWRDDDFLALSPSAQRLFLFLISQPELNHAGLLPLRVRRWAPKASGLTVAELRADLDALTTARFVVVDHDTEELLIRTHVRNDGVWKQPKVLAAAAVEARHIESPRLVQALLTELLRLPTNRLTEASQDELRTFVDALRARVPDTPPDTPAHTLPDTPPEGFPRDETEAADTPAEGYREPSARARAHSPTPSPTPVPPTAGAVALRDDEPPDTTQTLIGEWLSHCRKRPPGQTINRVGKSVRGMLAEGIDAADVRTGLAHWHQRGLDPSTLPSVVNELMNASPSKGRASTTDQRVQAGLELAARYEAEDAQRARRELAS